MTQDILRDEVEETPMTIRPKRKSAITAETHMKKQQKKERIEEEEEKTEQVEERTEQVKQVTEVKQESLKRKKPVKKTVKKRQAKPTAADQSTTDLDPLADKPTSQDIQAAEPLLEDTTISKTRTYKKARVSKLKAQPKGKKEEEEEEGIVPVEQSEPIRTRTTRKRNMPKYNEDSMDTIDSSSLPLVENDTTAPNTQSSVDLSEIGASTNVSSMDIQPVATESPNTELLTSEKTSTKTKAPITTEPLADIEKTETIPLPEQQNDTETTSISPTVTKRGVRKNTKKQGPNPKPPSARGRGRKKVSKDTEQEVNETQLAHIPEAQPKQDYNHEALEFLLTDKSSYLVEADLRAMIPDFIQKLPIKDQQELASLLPSPDKTVEGNTAQINPSFSSTSNNFFWESVRRWQECLALGQFDKQVLAKAESRKQKEQEDTSFKDENYETYWGERLERDKETKEAKLVKTKVKSTTRGRGRGRGTDRGTDRGRGRGRGRGKSKATP